jgi:ABC-2 type transport system ATP-binding protein
MVEVERLCERIVFLSFGKVVADGTAAEITERFGRADLEEVFLHLADLRDAARRGEPAADSATDLQGAIR